MAFKIDWDGLFTYSTVKIVKIRDKRLGILHLVFLVGIVLYILTFSIFLQKRYLAIDTPIGSIRTSLLQPSYRNPSPPYCNSTQPTYKSFPNLPCEYWDENLVLYPVGSDESLFITTRVESSYQTTLNNCSLSQANCTYQSITPPGSDGSSSPPLFYIADITNFTILLDHTLSAPSLNIQYNARQLPGQLLKDGKPWTPPAPSVVGVANQYDILTVGACLEAAGLSSLDGPGLVNNTRSIRNDGLVILVFITYSNTWSYNTGKIRYTYEFQVIPNTKYKVVEPIYTTDVSHRYLFDRHGIKMIFIQTGTLGKFDFPTMLLTFVSGIGLVTVATVVVDILAVKLLPQKEKYQQLKYQEASTKTVPLLSPLLTPSEVNDEGYHLHNDD